MGKKEDKEQEPNGEDIIGLDLNIDQATITYLSYERSIEEAQISIAEFKHMRTIPVEKRPDEFRDPQVLNDSIKIANFALTHLRYLHGEVKTIIIELTPPEKEESTIIKPPNWKGKQK